MKNKLFIAFEGVDRVGKTTHSKLLARKIDADIYVSPETPHNNIKNEVNQKCDELTKLLFYLSGNIHVSKKISTNIENRAAVCDRYILSTLANNSYMGKDHVLKYYNLIENEIMIPDYTFLLHSEKDIIKERIKENSMSFKDTTLLETPEKIDIIYEKFIEMSEIFPNAIIIDTHGTIQNVSEKIYSEIEGSL